MSGKGNSESPSQPNSTPQLPPPSSPARTPFPPTLKAPHAPKMSTPFTEANQSFLMKKKKSLKKRYPKPSACPLSPTPDLPLSIPSEKKPLSLFHEKSS